MQFRFEEPAGPHAVGLKVVEQYDFSRDYLGRVDELGKLEQGERARPIQTLVWYPARDGKGKRMTVGDYVDLSAAEKRFDRPRMPPSALEKRSAMGSALAMPMRAIRDAGVSGGRFPVVVYAPGAAGSAWENADLCEYLASHGYVVIASPALGQSARRTTFDVEGANARARDISFLIGYARTLPDADVSEVAVAGFSWGGMAALFAAARDSRIDALISLDGSPRYFPDLVRQAGDVHPAEMTIPLLYFQQRNLSIEDQEITGIQAGQGPNVANAWRHGDLIAVHMLGLTHRAFSSMHQRDEDFWWEMLHYWPMLQGDYGRNDAMAGYRWMARYTLRYLDSYLKHDPEALRFLRRTPLENGVPAHAMVVDYRAAVGTVTSFETFCSEVARRGFERVSEVYAAFKQRDDGFRLEEPVIFSWADELLQDDRNAEAIALLKLSAAIYPDSSSSLVRLGDAYVHAGQNLLAIESYRDSLRKLPANASQNALARTKLHRLTAQSENHDEHTPP